MAGEFKFKKGQTYRRGGLDYYQPSAPWERDGLKVKNKYDNGNNEWLAMNGNPNEWAVSFHGIKNASYVIPKVLNEGMREGPGQKYKNRKCL